MTGVLLEIIRRYKKYGFPDWGYLEASDYGPSLGPEIERKDEFIVNATRDLNLSPDSIKRVKDAMNCASCHEDFAPLNYLQAVPNDRDISGTFRRYEGLIESNIEEGWMPRNVTLTQTERTALYRSLTKEYCDFSSGSGVFIDWLKGKGPLEDNGFNLEKMLRDGPASYLTMRETLDHGDVSLKNVLTTPDIAPASFRREIQRAKELSGSGKFVDAEKILWDNQSRLLRSDIRGETRRQVLESIYAEMGSLYNLWKPSVGHPGLKRLNDLRAIGGHGE